jgi:hypothetical protein
MGLPQQKKRQKALVQDQRLREMAECLCWICGCSDSIERLAFECLRRSNAGWLTNVLAVGNRGLPLQQIRVRRLSWYKQIRIRNMWYASWPIRSQLKRVGESGNTWIASTANRDQVDVIRASGDMKHQFSTTFWDTRTITSPP